MLLFLWMALRILIELFDYILYYSMLPPASEVRRFIDSKYVIRSSQGDQLPSTHYQLVELAQQYFAALRAQHFVILDKVSSHIGIPGNEVADALARRGVSSYGVLGRFSFPRTQPLSPPSIGYNSQIWMSKTPQEQCDFISQLFYKHLSSIPVLPASPKKPWISAHTLFLISEFQQ